MDSLSEGLSNLTPTSPTTAGPPPMFPAPPLADVLHSEHISVNALQSHAPTLLSQSAPSTLCHIRTDHAYQVRTLTAVAPWIQFPAPFDFFLPGQWVPAEGLRCRRDQTSPGSLLVTGFLLGRRSERQTRDAEIKTLRTNRGHKRSSASVI